MFVALFRSGHENSMRSLYIQNVYTSSSPEVGITLELSSN